MTDPSVAFFRFVRRAWQLPLLLALGALAACESTTLSLAPLNEILADLDDVVAENEIVVLAETKDAAQTLAMRSRPLGYRVRTTEELTALGMTQLVLDVPAGRTAMQAIGELERLAPGITAGANHAYRAQGVASPRTYAAEAIGWANASCTMRHPVGVLDSGGSLESGALSVTDFTGGRPSADDHGAEIVRQLSSPDLFTQAQVHLGVVVRNSDGAAGEAGVDDLIRGIDGFLARGVRIMNVSLSGPYNMLLDRAVQRASQRGAIIVAAVGNDGPQAKPRYPAAFRQVIAVTAVDAADQPYQRAVRGRHVDVAAPGVQIFIDYKDGLYRTGTSYAAPYVTALLAAGEQHPVSVREARKMIYARTDDLGAEGRDAIYGVGRLNAQSACQ
ncbi:MAG: S8 family serine peptidase [Parvularculaceae bacterium]|nr:S8 family serine peptidase [Parvularculaceae bacterium]